jgi:hypothetical protein
MITNLISINSTIGRFLKDLGLEGTSYVEDIPRWTEDAISILGASSYYVYRRQKQEVRDYKCPLPCDMEVLHSIFVTDTLEEALDIKQLKRLFIRDSPMFGGDLFTTTNGAAAYGSINGNTLHTSFDKGVVYFVYKGIPIDCDGMPLVPKSAELNTALQYYYIYRMALSGYKHPVLDFKDALQLWERHYPRASNDINWMNLQEYQAFTELWTNPLLGDLNANNYIY